MGFIDYDFGIAYYYEFMDIYLWKLNVCIKDSL